MSHLILALAAALGAQVAAPALPVAEPRGPDAQVLALQLTIQRAPVAARLAEAWSLQGANEVRPSALDVHPSGLVAGIDARRHQLFLLDGGGAWLGFGATGGTGAGLASAEQLFARTGLKIFTLDAQERGVDRYDLRGAWEARFDLASSAAAAGERLERPVDLCLDRAGTLFILDAARGEILRFDPDGRWAGRIETWGDWQLVAPVALEVDGRGRLYVLDRRPAVVWVLESSGRLAERRELRGPGDEEFEPGAFAVDLWGNVFVVHGRGGRILVVPAGQGQAWWIEAEGAVALAGLAIGAEPRLLAADASGRRILIYALDYQERDEAAREP